MKPISNLIERLNQAKDNVEMDINLLQDCIDVLEQMEDKYVNEISAKGYVYDVQYLHHNDKKNGLIKFLFEKMRRDSQGKAIRGKIACVMDETKLTTQIMDGDRVKIKGDFSPYTTKREDGQEFHKMRIWVDSVERIARGMPQD